MERGFEQRGVLSLVGKSPPRVGGPSFQKFAFPRARGMRGGRDSLVFVAPKNRQWTRRSNHRTGGVSRVQAGSVSVKTITTITPERHDGNTPAWCHVLDSAEKKTMFAFGSDPNVFCLKEALVLNS